MKRVLGMLLFGAVLAYGQTNNAASDKPLPKKAVLKEIKTNDHVFLVDGKEFFVKGISYSPFYPGETNRDETKRANIPEDVQKMKDLGANTILIYFTRSENVYKAARENEMMILQGIWMEQNPPDFQDEHFKNITKRKIKHVIDYIHNLNGTDYSDTVLGLWLGGELDMASIQGTDDRHPEIKEYKGKYYQTPKNASPTECFMAEMCDFGRQYANDKYGHDFLFSHINWPSADQWLRLGFLDYVLFDVYTYWPPSVASFRKGSFAPTSYQGYLENLKHSYAKKPLIISEFGFSTAPDNSTETGNNERDQAAGLIRCWHDIVTADGPLGGGCVFEWNDEWWKQSGAATLVPHGTDINYHERDDGEEWFGIVGIDGVSKVSYKVKPKPAFYAVSRMFSPSFLENRRDLRPILVDQFRQPANLLGNKWEILPQPLAGFELSRVPDNDVRTSMSLKVSLDRSKEIKDQPIWYKSSLVKAEKPLDASQQLHFTFYVRGKMETGGFKVKMESTSNKSTPEQTWGLSDSIDKYLTKKQLSEIGKDWQKVHIPLEHFGALDFAKLTSVSLVFDDAQVTRLDVELKDLGFSPNY